MLRASKASQEELAGIDRHLRKMAGLAALVLASMGSAKKSLTFVEGILVGILANVDALPEATDAAATTWARTKATAFEALPLYGAGARYALASAPTVKARLAQAIAAFA